MSISRSALLFLVVSCQVPASTSTTVALIADVQYADKPTAGARHYRLTLEHLEACVEDLSSGEPLAFAIQFGDLIDGREADPALALSDLDRVLARLGKLDMDVLHVVGNHCLEVPRAQLEQRLGLTESSSYSRSLHAWRFIVLDTMRVSVLGLEPSDPRLAAASERLAALKAAKHPNATSWNGGVGAPQRDWLAGELAAAVAAGERAIVIGHHPLLAAASSEHHLAWDHEQVRQVLAASPASFVYISGHCHAGGFASDAGIHHLTLKGMVEAPEGSNTYARLRLFADRLELDGVGLEPDRVLLDLR